MDKKQSTKLLLAIASLFVVAIASSCSGNKQQVNKNLPVSDFTLLNIEGKMDVELIQAVGAPSITVLASEGLLKEITLNQRGAEVTIVRKKGMSFRDEEPRVTIRVNKLDEIKLNNDVDVRSTGLFTTETMLVKLSNDCELKNFKVSANTNNLNIDRKSDLDGSFTGDVNLEVNKDSEASLSLEGVSGIALNASGDSEVKMYGRARDLTLSLIKNSSLEAGTLEVQSATVSLQGNSEAEIGVKENLNYSVSGRSKLVINGNPTIDKGDLSRNSTFITR